MTDNLFEAPDQDASLREELLAKWKDKPLEDVLKAKVESDLYIKTLEKQKDELRKDYLEQRDKLLAQTKFEELIDRFEKAPKNIPEAPPEAKEESKFDPKMIEDLVEQKIKQSKLSDRQNDNFTKVQNKLRERYGDNYATVLEDQRNQLGLSADDVNTLAKKSPEGFFRIMGLNEVAVKNEFQAPPKSAQRNDQFSPRGQPKRDYAFYQEMKKTNPKAYLDPKIAVQMHNDVIEMGEAAFYGQS